VSRPTAQTGRAAPAYVTSFVGKAVKVMTSGVNIRKRLAHVYGPATRTSHLVPSHSLTKGARSGNDASTRDGSAHNENPEPYGARIRPILQFRIQDPCPPGDTYSQAEDGMALMASRFFEQLVEEHRNNAHQRPGGHP
jgi:hypothetical protein